MHHALSMHPIPTPSHLGPVIDAIGEQGFEAELLWFLNETCDAEHCAIFSLDGPAPTEVSAASLEETQRALAKPALYLQAQRWRRDPSMVAARQHPDPTSANLIRLDIARLEDPELRELVFTQIGDRLLLYGPSVAGPVALSILKSGDGNVFDRKAILRLAQVAALLLPIIGKHASALLNRRRTFLTLTSLEDIEGCICRMSEGLPRRESQVCARIVYGMSSMGIALELGISEETVMTYRKRIYQRLNIATQRELLLWYVTEGLRPSPAVRTARH
jgi:DNA-binding CsgD family transcriptional regulator